MVIWPAEVVLVIRYLEGLHVAHHPAQLSEQEVELSASVVTGWHRRTGY